MLSTSGGNQFAGQNGENFCAAAGIQINTMTGLHTIMSKGIDSAGFEGWMLEKNGSTLRFRAHIGGAWHTVECTSSLQGSVDTLVFGGRRENHIFVGFFDNASVDYQQLEVPNGGVKANSQPFRAGGTLGRYYWFGATKDSVVPMSQFRRCWEEATTGEHPLRLCRDVFVDFQQGAPSSYTADFPSGTTLQFNKNGAFSQSGSTNSSIGAGASAWSFHGNSCLVLTDANGASDMDSGTGDFSVFVRFRRRGSSGEDFGLVGKYDYGNNRRTWRFYIEVDAGGNLEFAISRDGDTSPISTIVKDNAIPVTDTKRHAACFTFSYIGTSNVNDGRLYLDSQTATFKGNMYPPHSNTSSLVIGGLVSSDTPRPSMVGDIECVAYFNFELTQVQYESLRDETAQPEDLSAILVWRGEREVDTTYTAESGTGTNAPYPFDVTKTTREPTLNQENKQAGCAIPHIRLDPPLPKPEDAWWEFSATNGVAINCKTADQADFDIPTNDHISWAAIMELDTNAFANGIWKWWSGGCGYYGYDDGANLVIRFNGSSGQATCDIAGASPTGEKFLMAGVLKNVGTDTYDGHGYRISASGGTEHTAHLGRTMSAFTTNQLLNVFGHPADSRNLDGKGYVAAIWKGTAVTQEQLEAIFEGTLLPQGIPGCILVMTMNQAPGVSPFEYPAEYGGYTLDVVGTPVGYNVSSLPTGIPMIMGTTREWDRINQSRELGNFVPTDSDLVTEISRHHRVWDRINQSRRIGNASIWRIKRPKP
jgi:hypothetical protein